MKRRTSWAAIARHVGGGPWAGAAGGGYASGGSLPPSRCASTLSSVRPGTPHHTRRPSLFYMPLTTDAPLVGASLCSCRRSKYAAHAEWLSAAYWGRARCSSVREARASSTSSAK